MDYEDSSLYDSKKEVVRYNFFQIFYEKKRSTAFPTIIRRKDGIRTAIFMNRYLNR